MTSPIFQAPILLVLLIVTSLIDMIVLNRFVTKKAPRGHNKLLLANECLARHQLAYTMWYITLTLVADFSRLPYNDASKLKAWIGIAGIISVFSWLLGLNAVSGQNEVIERYHPTPCTVISCDAGSWSLTVNVLIMNSVLALFSIIVATTFLVFSDVLNALAR